MKNCMKVFSFFEQSCCINYTFALSNIDKILTNPQQYGKGDIKTSESDTWDPHVGYQSPSGLLPNLQGQPLLHC